MTKDQAVRHFGTQWKLAYALGLSQGTIAGWPSSPPELRQLQIEAVTGGALQADPVCDKYRVPKRKAKPTA